MNPYYADDAVTLYAGDCLDVLPTLPDCSVDAVVTDPPAGISFMGRDWDHHKGGREQWSAWLAEVMREAYRVAKPGAHALVWALPRTSHWTAIGIEDAGWEIRDRITHLFGTGFPKSLDVSKAIDRAAGAEREVVGQRSGGTARPKGEPFTVGGLHRWGDERYTWDELPPQARDYLLANVQRANDITAPATTDAQRWQGWGTALKPAAEDWWLARKPLTGTVAANVLAHGTGALNVDGCRIEADWDTDPTRRGWQGRKAPDNGMWGAGNIRAEHSQPNPAGRWPANVTLDETAATALDHMSGEQRDGVAVRHNGVGESNLYGAGMGALPVGTPDLGYGAGGGASRFFYTAKAGSDERITHDGIAHPTVKPLSLMRWLVRLVTPPGGVILEPFAGSGTTIEAALIEGFRCIAIEREADYLPLITQRLNRRRNPVAYLAAAGEDLGLFDEDEPA